MYVCIMMHIENKEEKKVLFAEINKTSRQQPGGAGPVGCHHDEH